MSPREIASGTIWPTRWKADPSGASVRVCLPLRWRCLCCRNRTGCQPWSGSEKASAGSNTPMTCFAMFPLLKKRFLKPRSGERGYLLTGERSYFDSYNRAQADIPKLLEAVRQAVSDNPGQTQRLDELRPSIEARLAEFKQVMELGPARLNEALAILRTARSRQLTL